MKKIIIAISIGLSILNLPSFGQTINLSMDSITTLICKKWEVDYALTGEMKIGRTSGAPDINFEFKKDKTFITTMGTAKEKHVGTWSYDSNKKLIMLMANGKNAWRIISLKEGELIMLPDIKSGMREDQMKIVYKIKSS